MKKNIIIMGLCVLLCSSCVTYGKYSLLETKNAQLRKDYNATMSEINDLRDENAELQRQNQSLSAEIVDLNDTKNQQAETLLSLRQEMANMKMGYDTVVENYMQRITGQGQDLKRANDLLAIRTQELSEKEAAYQAKQAELLQKQADMSRQQAEMEQRQREMAQRQSELESREASTRRALEAKEKELEQLRNSLNNALVGFADKGLNVETRDGKVYVSMESKLLFPSASWTVSKEGADALKTLAKVLETNKDLNIMVEGHTDNAAFKGNTAVKDNWDLSVMRATSIVKLLLQHGPGIDPARIEACGHAEFAPKASNDTPEGKALNRRTEIILTPKMSDILNLIEQ